MKNNEIDLKKIYNSFFSNILNIFYLTILFFFIGVVIYLIIPIKYTSSVTFSLSQSSQNTVDQSISNIASLAGFDFNENNEYINPAFYPKILEDINIKRKILNIKLDSNLIYGDYVLNNKLIEIDQYFTNNDEISEKEFYQFKQIDDMLSIEVDDNLGLIKITTEMSIGKYSYIVTKNVYEILQTKIINLSAESSNNILNFITENYNQKKKEFYQIQDELSSFEDKNQTISSSKFDDEKFRIENEFNLKFNIFNELSKQVELTKIEINKNTPIFMILTNPYIPYKKSSPSFIIVVALFSLFGFFLSTIFYTIKDELIDFIIN